VIGDIRSRNADAGPGSTEAIVTFLLTDIQGSTGHWEASPDRMRQALEVHDRLVSETIESHGGRVLTTHGEGDSFFAVFPLATEAVATACLIQEQLTAQPWPEGARLLVRMALHTGEAGGDYRGRAANRCARLRACGHGGQVLLSATSAELVKQSLPGEVRLLDLGRHRLRGLARPEQIFQLVIPGLPASFPRLKSLKAAEHARVDVLEQVRRYWLDSELAPSLNRMARIELGLAERPGAIDNSLRAVLRRPHEPDRLLERGVPIAAAYRQFGRQLLILGEPGVGKTTMLLELADQLLEELEDPSTAPMPVIFHLSSWAVERRTLAAWLVDELHKRYGVARRLGQTWVDTDQIIPLLDGLDEVAAEHRDACVAAINSFHEGHGQLPLVVCSRLDEYEALSRRLKLRGAIVIQNLTRAEVDQYLHEAGHALAGVRAVLDEDEQLAELLTTPLFLSIVAITYKGQPSAAVRGSGTLEERRQRVLADYVAGMMNRPRAAATQRLYSFERTRSWLAWLAQTMKAHHQSIFYIDWMQPHWLPNRKQQHLATVGVAVSVGLVGGLIVGLLAGLLTKQLSGLFIDGLLGAVVGGLAAALVAALAVHRLSIARTEQLRGWQARLRDGLFSGLMLGLGCGLVFELVVGMRWGLTGVGSALIATLMIGLGVGLVTGLETNETPAAPGKRTQGLQRNVLVAGLTTGLIIGGGGGGLASAMGAGLGVGLVVGLAAQELNIAPTEQLHWSEVALRRSLTRGLAFGLALGLAWGLLDWQLGRTSGLGIVLGFGPVFALAFGLVFGLVGGLETRPHVTPAVPGKGMQTSRHSALVSGIGGGVVVGLGFGLLFALGGEGLVNGLKDGLGYGVGSLLGAGLIVAMGSLLAAEGTIALGSLVGAVLILLGAWLTVKFHLPLAALIPDVAGGLILGLSLALQRGGGAYLNHNAIRTLLVRNGFAPRDYVAFLDYAASIILLNRRGGGYQFPHRLLLEYFAALDPPLDRGYSSTGHANSGI
jgi:class 3 adenylate cyclase